MSSMRTASSHGSRMQTLALAAELPYEVTALLDNI